MSLMDLFSLRKASGYFIPPDRCDLDVFVDLPERLRVGVLLDHDPGSEQGGGSEAGPDDLESTGLVLISLVGRMMCLSPVRGFVTFRGRSFVRIEASPLAMTLSTRLSERSLLLARSSWILGSLVAVALWLAGAYANLSVPLPSCAGSPCDPFALSLEDFEMMRSLGLPARSLFVFWQAGGLLIGVFFFATAGLIFWRRSDDIFSLVVSFFLVFLGAVAFTEFDDAVNRVFPILRGPLNVIFILGWPAMVLVFFYFPDGRLVPDRPWMRWGVLLFLAFFAVQGAGPVRSLRIGPAALALLVLVGSGLWSQVHRYRRVSGPAQKQQTKWVIFGLAGAAIVMMLWIRMAILHPPYPATAERIYNLLWVRPVIIILISGFPLTFVFSIVRYRLWDIDILIRRTLSYGLLTGILLAVYFSGVVVLQSLFSTVSGEGRSPLVTVVSTLAIAGLFNPLRLRIQDFIDRRFFRAKFNADRTLAHFAETARDEVDIEVLGVAILGVVDETVQPERISLWLQER